MYGHRRRIRFSVPPCDPISSLESGKVAGAICDVLWHSIQLGVDGPVILGCEVGVLNGSWEGG